MKDKQKFYNQIAGDFDSIMNMYDTNRRIEVIFKDFLGKTNLAQKKLLDAGCGTGLFTKEALARKAKVTSIDIASKLVKLTKNKNPKTTALTASLLKLPFENNHFDIVICSDVIEHTKDPYRATKELIRVLKPGGYLALTVPNRSFWYFSVILANLLGIRKYSGYENWVYYKQYQNFLIKNKLNINYYKGVHLFPFVLGKYNYLIKKLDQKFEKVLSPCMVNIAVLAQK
ncbi:methyltransferase domain-containing protein [Candidatus Beckwithbacteria bacterium]|nr:methyltransferase domain-containing protein [Candidatus Beckwithbacteria bacterium]